MKSTGAILIYGVKKVVAEVGDPGQGNLAGGCAENSRRCRNGFGNPLSLSPPTRWGRISAQTAKQVILQKVREAERDKTCFRNTRGRIGELVRSEVKRIEGPDLIVGMGKTEARLLKREQSKLESFSVGDRIALRHQERRQDRQETAGVIISRGRAGIGDAPVRTGSGRRSTNNTVVIKGCAREAGERTKIAVSSREPATGR